MPDREKVIKGMEICTLPASCNSDCPYYEKEGAECSYCLMKDALELLKEQEPVKPEIGKNGCGSCWYICPECRLPIAYKDMFCRHCGRRLSWDV